MERLFSNVYKLFTITNVVIKRRIFHEMEIGWNEVDGNEVVTRDIEIRVERSLLLSTNYDGPVSKTIVKLPLRIARIEHKGYR